MKEEGRSPVDATSSSTKKLDNTLFLFLIMRVHALSFVLDVLAQFKLIYGLSVNLDKTSLFTAVLSQPKIDDLVMRFCLSPATLPVLYLGLLLCSRKLSHADSDTLLSRILAKTYMYFWTLKFLSFGGRLTAFIFGDFEFLLPQSVIRLTNSLLK